MAELDPKITTEYLDNFMSSITDATSVLQTQAQVMSNSLTDYNKGALDLVDKITKNKTGMTLTLRRMISEVGTSMTEVREKIVEGSDFLITDISSAISELVGVEKELIKRGVSEVKLKDFREQVTQLKNLQSTSEALQSNLKAANQQASSMAKRFMSFVDNIPYIGDIISEATGLRKIRRNLEREFGKALMGILTESTSVFTALKRLGTAAFGAIGQSMSALLLNPIVLLAALAALAVKRFLSLEKAAEDFRREVGLSGTQTREIERSAQAIAVQFKNMGVDVENVYKSAGSFVEVLGRTDVLTDNILKNTSLYSTALGISEKTTAGFVKNLSMISDMSLESANNFQASVYSLAEQSKVAPVKVIEDIANASENALIAFGGMSEKLASAAIRARQLGTTISQIADETRGLLDFQSSISAEMQASTLLGRNLNLQYARQLRFADDIKGANEEILNQVRRIGDFDSLNVFQKEAIAKATGKTVSELSKQLMMQDLSLKYGDKIKDIDYETLKAKKAAGELNQDTINQLIREKDLRADQAKMMAELKSIGLSLSQVLLPIVQLVSSILIPAFKFIGALVRTVLKPFQEILGRLEDMGDKLNINVDIMGSIIKTAEILGTVLGSLLVYPIQFYVSLIPIFKMIGGISTAMLGVIKSTSILKKFLGDVTSIGMGFVKAFKIFEEGTLLNILAKMGKIGETIFDFIPAIKGFAQGFGKAIPVIGWILFGIETIIRSVKNFFNIWTDGSLKLGDKFVETMKVVPMAVFDTLISPFKMVMNWLGGFFDSSDLGDRFFGVFKTAFRSILDWFYAIPQFIVEIFTKGPEEAIANFFSNSVGVMVGVGDLIVSGLRAVSPEILNALLQPFYDGWNWLKATFLGNSPSILGLGIVKGIQSITGIIADVLASPFMFVFDSVKNFGFWMRENIIRGLSDLPSSIFKIITSPFMAVWDWLKGTFFGNSPSQLGLNIVKGIQGVTGLISDILLAPFKLVWNVGSKIFDALFGKSQQDPTQAMANSLAELSEGKLSLIKEVASLLSSDSLSSNILKTAESIDALSDSINKISVMNVMKLTVMNAGEAIKTVTEKKPTEEKVSVPTRNTDDDVVSKLNELINLMKDGGISVNLDGRKVSKGLVSKVY